MTALYRLCFSGYQIDNCMGIKLLGGNRMKCDHCGKEISKGDEYISVAGQEQRYCQGCFSTDTTINYYVGGEYVGNDNCVDEYDSYDLEEETK